MIEPKSAAVINPRSHRLRAGICLLAGVICASFTLVHAANAQTKISIGYSPFIDALTAFAAKDKEQVDRIHKLALSLGGCCEGPPGQRMENFYAAYFRDPEGNKLNAFVMG